MNHYPRFPILEQPKRVPRAEYDRKLPMPLTPLHETPMEGVVSLPPGATLTTVPLTPLYELQTVPVRVDPNMAYVLGQTSAVLLKRADSYAEDIAYLNRVEQITSPERWKDITPSRSGPFVLRAR